MAGYIGVQIAKQAISRIFNLTWLWFLDGRFKGFLDHILESPENSLSEQEIREEIDTIVFAGYDSTATVLTYLLTALGSYPEVQERVYAE